MVVAIILIAAVVLLPLGALALLLPHAQRHADKF